MVVLKFFIAFLMMSFFFFVPMILMMNVLNAYVPKILRIIWKKDFPSEAKRLEQQEASHKTKQPKFFILSWVLLSSFYFFISYVTGMTDGDWVINGFIQTPELLKEFGRLLGDLLMLIVKAIFFLWMVVVFPPIEFFLEIIEVFLG